MHHIILIAGVTMILTKDKTNLQQKKKINEEPWSRRMVGEPLFFIPCLLVMVFSLLQVDKQKTILGVYYQHPPSGTKSLYNVLCPSNHLPKNYVI